MKNSDQIAIIGPTASGKTSLAVEVAKKYNGVILSLDSLSIYRHIDIASAKPTAKEMGDIVHFGIDVIEPDELFDVTRFAELYRQANKYATQHSKPLIIVGGTSFYLKMLIDGISPLPDISDETKNQVDDILLDLPTAHKYLSKIDNEYAKRIEPSDKYRIEKALSIFLATGTTPSKYFSQHPPTPVIQCQMPIYEITAERDILRAHIAKRAKQMLSQGLIDEVCYLEQKYTRTPSPMKAIGIREVFDYLDGIYTYEEMQEKIITNTARLAKRQRTFNNSQFDGVIRGSLEELRRGFGM